MDAKTDELRAAHDVLAEFYAERLAGLHEQMPVDGSVVRLFTDMVRAAGKGTEVADVGCGTGRLMPFLAGGGLEPIGLDLSPEMVRVARREQPGFRFQEADVRALPLEDDSLAGVVGWYSLMYLAPADRPVAFAELARVVRPGGHLLTAFKAGDGTLRRGGRRTGLDIGFDIYWLSPDEVQQRAADAGFETVFWAGRPALEFDDQPQGYLIARLRED